MATTMRRLHPNFNRPKDINSVLWWHLSLPFLGITGRNHTNHPLLLRRHLISIMESPSLQSGAMSMLRRPTAFESSATKKQRTQNRSICNDETHEFFNSGPNKCFSNVAGAGDDDD